MFSKFKNSPRQEIRGVFRSLFGNGGDGASSPRLQEYPNQKLKTSFGRRMKSRLSSLMISSGNWKTEGRFTSTPIYNESYNAIASPHPDLVKKPLSISSILKKSKLRRCSNKKKIRFLDEDDEFHTAPEDKESEPATPTPTNERVPDASDLEYYTKMKEEILMRNQDIIKKTPLKRKASTATPAASSESRKVKMSKFEESPPKYPSPFEMVLKKWSLNTDSLFQEGDYSLDEPVHFDNQTDFKGKLAVIRKVRSDRYDPITSKNSKSNEPFVVSLNFLEHDANRMSWCSA